MPNYAELNEKELLLLLKERDHLAFNQLYDMTWQSLFHVAYQRLKDKETCKDIVHDVFTDLWNKCDSKNIDSLLPYLHSAVRYKIYTWIARGNGTAHFVEPFEGMAVSSQTADSWFELHELEKLVALWIKTLPAKRQMIFRLKFVDNLSTKDIGYQLNVSQKTVQNQLLTAYHDLQVHISHYLTLLVIIFYFY